MNTNFELKKEAIRLRKMGLSYFEINNRLSVPKSTLSGWVKGIKLSNSQKQRLFLKGVEARKKGSAALMKSRVTRTAEIIKRASEEIGPLNDKSLMLIGITLYWAEGSKQWKGNISKGVVFNNSDPKMVQVFLKWLKECLNISDDRIVFEIYIHKSHKKTIKELVSYWSRVTKFPEINFKKIYFKKNKIHTIRRNRGLDYSGVLRISVRKSTDLSREIAGWVVGIYEGCGVASQNEI